MEFHSQETPTSSSSRCRECSGESRVRDTHYNLGSAYVAKGRLVEAEAEFHRAVECSPTLVEAYVQLAAGHDMAT